MDQEEDEYSDRDASGEEDTDFVDVNLSGRVDGVALDPALNEQAGYSYHDVRQQMPHGYENGYSLGSGYEYAPSVGYSEGSAHRQQTYGHYPMEGYPDEAIYGNQSGRADQHERAFSNPYLDDNMHQAMPWAGDTIHVQPPGAPYVPHYDTQHGMQPMQPMLFPTPFTVPPVPEAGPSSSANGIIHVKRPGRPPGTPHKRVQSNGGRPTQKKQKSAAGNVQQAPCAKCNGVLLKRANGKMDVMLSCSTCGQTGHATCLGFSDILAKNALSYAWQCEDCKQCETCKSKEDEIHTLMCDVCDRGYHKYCLVPKLSAPPKDEWICPRCQPVDLPSAPPIPMVIDKHVETIDIPADETVYPSNGVRQHTSEAIEIASKRIDKGKATETPISRQSSSVFQPKREVKRKALEPPVERPTVVKIKIPSMAMVNKTVQQSANKKKRKSIERPDNRATEPIEEEEPPVPFGGIITGRDADTTKTQIDSADVKFFEDTRRAAEIRLGGDENEDDRDTETPGPSDTGSIYGMPTSLPETPMHSGSRSLRDRLMLQTALSPGPSSRPVDSPFSGSLLGLVTARRSIAEKISIIRFGIYDIDTWYSAPYPEEYAKVPDGRLWLCEYCLKYMKSGFIAERHQMKCRVRCPPGDEIYRENSVSVFEVDGRKNKIYCQNLCLIAKMFLDHKTLYYDVEPFLFYVMTEVDEEGARFVGYFSKEKRSPHFNVSCIMTLPVRQRKGWGNLLIDFSYLLSKKEGRTGSPEKPLSGLGALSYRNYWKLAVFRYLDTASEPVTFEDISKSTSMTMEDILTTLVANDMITIRDEPAVLMAKKKKAQQRQREAGGPAARQAVTRTQTSDGHGPSVMPDDYTIHIDRPILREYLTRQDQKGYLRLRPERLKYTPFLVQRLTLTKNGMIESQTVAKAKAVEVQGEIPDVRPDADAETNGHGVENQAMDLELENGMSANQNPSSVPLEDAQSSDVDLGGYGQEETNGTADGQHSNHDLQRVITLSPSPAAPEHDMISVLPATVASIPQTPSKKGRNNKFSPSSIGNGVNSPGRRSSRNRTSNSMTPAPSLQLDFGPRSTRSGSRINQL